MPIGGMFSGIASIFSAEPSYPAATNAHERGGSSASASQIQNTYAQSAGSAGPANAQASTAQLTTEQLRVIGNTQAVLGGSSGQLERGQPRVVFNDQYIGSVIEYTGEIPYSYQWHYEGFMPREGPRPGADVYEQIAKLRGTLIKEVVISNENFNLLAQYLGLTGGELGTPIYVRSVYSIGTIIVRNEDHILNLDRFMEDDVDQKS